MNSHRSDPIRIADNADNETNDEALEAAYADIELENDEVTFAGEKSTLPRPPKKPNVYIEDETICLVCTQPGKCG